jgi:hypothetical protein
MYNIHIYHNHNQRNRNMPLLLNSSFSKKKKYNLMLFNAKSNNSITDNQKEVHRATKKQNTTVDYNRDQ